MAVKITGAYVSTLYCEFDSPGGAFPVPNFSKNVDLTEQYRSIFTFEHEDGVVKLECHFLASDFKLNLTFVLDEIVTEVVEGVEWTVLAIIKPNNTLKVTRSAEINGVVDQRTTQYLFTPKGLVVTLMRNDSDDVIVAYNYMRVPENIDVASFKLTPKLHVDPQ